jgi:hypothetical protein
VKNPLDFCDECQKLGYCKRLRDRQVQEEQEKRKSIALVDKSNT